MTATGRTGDACVVNENIDLAERIEGVVGERLDVVEIRYVTGLLARLDAFRGQFRHRLLQPPLAAGGDDHLGTLGTEAIRDGLADAGGPAP